MFARLTKLKKVFTVKIVMTYEQENNNPTILLLNAHLLSGKCAMHFPQYCPHG